MKSKTRKTEQKEKATRPLVTKAKTSLVEKEMNFGTRFMIGLVLGLVAFFFFVNQLRPVGTPDLVVGLIVWAAILTAAVMMLPRSKQ